MAVVVMFPSEAQVAFAEREADRIASDRHSRKTSRLCRCERHGTKECGNLAESLPDKPLCWPCWSNARAGRACVSELTHCEDCGGTLVLDHWNVVKCAACGEAAAIL